MNYLFIARNVLRQSSILDLSEFLKYNQQNLKQIDFNNLFQEAFNLYKKNFLDYLRLFHKYHQDIVFIKVENGENTLTILDEILIFHKLSQLEELIMIDKRIIEEFSINSIKCVLENCSKSFKEQRNSYQMIQKILSKRPDILSQKNINDKYNPLIQSLKCQQYAIACLLLQYDYPVLKSSNYLANQFHFLFPNRPIKGHRNSKNDNKIFQIAKMLCQKKVDIYQKNQNGKTAFDLCPKDLKQQMEKIYKSAYPNSGNYNHSSTNRQHSQKYKKSSKHNNNPNQFQSRKVSDSFSMYDSNIGSSINHHQNFNSQVVQNNNLSNNQSNSNKNLAKLSYKEKGKGKFELEGKQTMKQSNQLIRLNINSKEISCQKQTSFKYQTTIVKVLNFDELENQASMIFQKHKQIKEQVYNQLKQEHMNRQKNKTKLIQNQELKYYLKEDIKKFAQNLKKQNIVKNQSFDILLQNITSELESILPITVGLYGSYATELHLERSDIDIVIIPKPECHFGTRHIFERIMQKMSQMKEMIGQTVFLDKASVPIIKATSTAQYKYKSIDISFQHQNHNGLKSVSLIKEYLQLYPELNRLILILKNFIYQSNLYAPYSGGLSSYGLILMIFAFIQNQQKQNSISKNSNRDIDLRTAQLLIGFLKFYGFKMDYVTQKIIIVNPQQVYTQDYIKCTIYNPQWGNEFPPQPKLIIMDPLSEDNNVGKHTRRIRQIKMAFQLAYIAIHTNRRCRNKKSCESYRNIKNAKVPEIRFKQNKRPCCILNRMFRSTDNFDLHMY